MLVNPTNRPQQPANAEQIAGGNNPNTRAVPDDDGIRSDLSTNIPKVALRSRAARTPTRSERSGLFSILGSCFGRRPKSSHRQISSSDNAKTRPAYNDTFNYQGQARALIEVATSGMSAAKGNATTGLADSKSSSEVASFLSLGDKGIRRATTALQNIATKASFEYLSDAEIKKMPAESQGTLKNQSTQIAQMANTILKSTFLEGTENFTQFGTSSKGYTEALEKYPEQDQAIRAWVKDGLNLGTELVNTQDQILCQGRVQSESYISDLQSRVNVFASIERDMLEPVDVNIGMESFADEVLKQTQGLKE